MLPPRFIVIEIPADGAKPETVAVADSLADLCNRVEALGIAESHAKVLAADVLRLDPPNPHQGPHLSRVDRAVGELRREAERAERQERIKVWPDTDAEDADEDGLDDTTLYVGGE